MGKIPLSVSSTLTNLTKVSALSVSAYGNETGKTGEAAPVLIAVESTKTLDAEQFAAALPAKGGQGTEEQARLVVNAVASVLNDLVSEYGAFTANTPIGTIETFIAGSLESATDAIDPATNYPFIGVVVPSQLMAQFNDIETYVPSTACPASLKRICDVATGAHAIYGTDPFYLQGYGMTYGSTGEKAKLLNYVTRAEVCDVAIDAATKSEAQLTATLPGTAAIPAGTYWLQLITLAGGPAVGGTLWPLELKVELAEAIVPTPSLTKIKEGARTDNLVGFTTLAVVLSGTIPGGFKTSDALKLEGAPTTPTGTDYQANMLLTDKVTASTETSITLGNGFSNTSELPDGDWNGKCARVMLVRDGQDYALTFNFQNA